MIFLLLTISILAGAIGDGLYDRKIKMLGGLVLDIEIATLLLCMACAMEYHWIRYVLFYLFIRASIFDLIYNKTVDRPLMVMGTTKLWDKILNKVHPAGMIMFRVVCFVVGMSMIYSNTI